MASASQWHYLPRTEKEATDLIPTITKENRTLRWNILYVPVFAVGLVFCPFWLVHARSQASLNSRHPFKRLHFDSVRQWVAMRR